MEIKWFVHLDCPQCKRTTVQISGNDIWCLMCNWTRRTLHRRV